MPARRGGGGEERVYTGWQLGEAKCFSRVGKQLQARWRGRRLVCCDCHRSRGVSDLSCLNRSVLPCPSRPRPILPCIFQTEMQFLREKICSPAYVIPPPGLQTQCRLVHIIAPGRSLSFHLCFCLQEMEELGFFCGGGLGEVWERFLRQGFSV